MQILLPHDLRQKIRLRAESEDKAQGEVVRELIQKGLDAEQPRSTGDALLRLAALGKQLGIRGPKDLSTNHDDYLYGDKA